MSDRLGELFDSLRCKNPLPGPPLRQMSALVYGSTGVLVRLEREKAERRGCRLCEACLSDICHLRSARGPTTRWCKPCKKRRKLAKQRERYRRRGPCRCVDCGADISARGSGSTRCVEHAKEAKRRARGPVRRCVDCGADISARGSGSTRCVEHAKEAKRRARREHQRKRGKKKPHRFGPCLLLRDGSLCCWCGEPVCLGNGWQVDHWFPLAVQRDFGLVLVDSPRNWRLIHPGCNARKGASLPG